MLYQVFDNDMNETTNVLSYFLIVMCYISISICWIVSPVQGLQYAFLRAAKEGDLDKVRDLIGQGCPVSTTDQVKFALA